ncbi:flagellin [Pelagibacterium halotolerans]|uniref:flagellin N-terminal helical domain-containing protein n=1 Tax=Pelagibacterium halotolerans TaxID=531813 RepID=UPI00384BB6DD
MSEVTLSKAVRSNLLSLQNTADMMSATQTKLATGKKVNSALDNPTNFFTSSGLNARASDMNSLLDSMANGIQTLEAADNGLSSITKTLESMQSTLRQARQDKSFETASYAIDGADLDGTETVAFSGGAVGDTAVSVEMTNSQGRITADNAFTALDLEDAEANFDDSISFDVTGSDGATRSVVVTATDNTTLSVSIDGGAATTSTVADANAVSLDELVTGLNAAFDAASTPVSLTASNEGGNLAFTDDTAVTSGDASVTVSNLAVAPGAGTATGLAATDLGFGADGSAGTASLENTEAKTVDALVTAINNNANLDGKIRASNDNGKLRIENQSTQDLTVTGVDADGEIDGEAGTSTIEGNSVRAGLADQFNELRDQLDKLADDASFNGINLLRGDNLQITFNETGTSEINIQTENGETINSGNLGVPTTMEAKDLDSDANIDKILGDVKSALNEVRSQSSTFGSNLSIVQNRQDFTKNMVNTLETGASNLTLADANEEAANLLALQTRQQLSSTALSMASQADQAVLRLF